MAPIWTHPGNVHDEIPPPVRGDDHVLSASQATETVAEWRQSPGGRIAVQPGGLSRRYHLQFKEYADELDAFQLAAIELDTGEQVWLQRYEHDPERGTVVLADSQADLMKSLALVLQSLHLQASDVDWVANEPAVAVTE